MTLDARQVPLPCPSTIAVHNDRHMPWQGGLGFGTEMGGLRAHGFRRQLTTGRWQVKNVTPPGWENGAAQESGWFTGECGEQPGNPKAEDRRPKEVRNPKSEDGLD